MKEQARRMYKVTGMSTSTISNSVYARITFVHNEEARSSKDFKAKMVHTNREKNFALQ